MKKKYIAILLTMLVGGASGYGIYSTQTHPVKNNETTPSISKESGVIRDKSNTLVKDDDESKNKQDLQWRVEAVSDADDIIKSYLYLYSEANPEVEVKLDYIIGAISSLEAYPERYPQDGMKPIGSWYGGAGVEVVLRSIDSNTIDVMTKGIGDGVPYSSNWTDYDRWYEITIKYNSVGEIEGLETTELMKMNENPELSEESSENSITIEDFYGNWEIEEVVAEPEQHNYIGMLDQLMGTKVVLKDDYYECGDDVISNLELEVEKIDALYFPVTYGWWAEKVGDGHKEMYALHLKEDKLTKGHLYYVDGEIWSDYKDILFKLKRID